MKRIGILSTLVVALSLAGGASALDDWNVISLSDSVVSFGSITAGEMDSLVVTLTNGLGVPVQINETAFEETVFSASVTEQQLPAYGSVPVHIYFNSEQNVDYTDFLRIELDEGIRPLIIEVSAEVHYVDFYDSSTRNKWGEELKDSLTALIDDHNSLGYNTARDSMYGHIDNDSGWVECVYTGRTAYFSTREGANDNGFNCEHTWPQSFFGEAEPMKSDLFHLYPTDVTANSKRGSYDFGIVDSATWTQGGSKLGTDSEGQTVFEPRDVHKGNVARTHFYYIIRYDGDYNGYVDATKMEAHFRNWHVSDPVDGDEEQRNEDIYALQYNRNPFIDHPALADRISSFFGTATFLVAPEIATAPRAVDLGVIGYDTTVHHFIAVINSGNDTLHVSSISSASPGFSVSVASLELIPESCKYFRITYTSGTADVTDSTIVSISSDDDDESTIDVPVTVQVSETAAVGDVEAEASDLRLHQNYPNPFTIRTVIGFELDRDTEVGLSVYNVRGQLVSKVLRGKRMTPGEHWVSFSGKGLPSGIYYYRLTAGDFAETKRMVLLGPG